MRKRRKTTAQQLSARFQDDGQCFTDSEGGGSLEDACEVFATRIFNHERFEFADGSAIVISGGAWDFGFPGNDLDCRCWPSANHGLHHHACEADGVERIEEFDA